MQETVQLPRMVTRLNLHSPRMRKSRAWPANSSSRAAARKAKMRRIGSRPKERCVNPTPEKQHQEDNTKNAAPARARRGFPNGNLGKAFVGAKKVKAFRGERPGGGCHDNSPARCIRPVISRRALLCSAENSLEPTVGTTLAPNHALPFAGDG